jgi:PAS domain S-box-containing protein
MVSESTFPTLLVTDQKASPVMNAPQIAQLLHAESLADCALFSLDAAANVQSWNSTAQKLFGYTESEIIGQSIAVLFLPDDQAWQAPVRMLEEARLNGRFAEENRKVRKDGSFFWAEFILQANFAGDGDAIGYMVMVRDNTQRRRTLKYSTMMVELAMNAMIMVDAAGLLIAVNPQTEKMFGYSSRELLGRSVEQLVPARFRIEHPENRERFFAAPAVRAMGSGRDLFGQRKDGTEFPVEIGLNPVETDEGLVVLGSIVDITERKKAEDRFRLAVESAPNSMVMTEADGRIVLANLETERLFGYSRQELIGQLVEILVPDRYRAQHPAFRQEFFRRPEARSMGMGRNLSGRRKDGSEFPVEVGLNPIETKEGLRVLIAIVDITERKRLESQARRLLIETAHAARLSTVGEMISGLAHEINQPLAAASNYLRGCIRLAQNGRVITNEELIHWMELAASQTTRACEIVTRLGAFVKKGEARRSRINLNHLIEQTIAMSTTTLDAGKDALDAVTVQQTLDPSIPIVNVDRIQIQQVLSNLIRNALEAMREAPPERRFLRIRSEVQLDMVRVSVEDTGSGIAPEHLQRLFEAFFTTKDTGIGLGLSISRSIIEQHQGEFTVSSTLGQGTVFSFTLPTRDLEIAG